MIRINMRMPKNCKECPMCHTYGGMCVLFDGVPAHALDIDGEKRPTWCPLQEGNAKPVEGDYLKQGFKYLCGKCGFKIYRNQEYCAQCGTKVEWDD